MKSKEDYNAMFEKPKNDLPQARPLVRGTVILLSFIGISNALIALFNINQLNQLMNDPSFAVANWLLPTNYAIIILGIVGVVAAFLIARYKRLGLILGGICIIVNLVGTFIAMSNFGTSPGCIGIISIILQFAALYYINRYLTRQPESTFFS